MTTEWRPDTCACVLQYDEIHGESGVPIWTSFVSCGVHPNATAAYNTNRQKNDEINGIAKALATEAHLILDKVSFKLQEDGSVAWNLDELSSDEKDRAVLSVEETRARRAGVVN